MSDPRPHPALLLGLTSVAASMDAISYLGLGKVFPANMTGNTVLLTIGVAQKDYPAAIRSAVALAGFVIGAACAGWLTRGRGWNRRIVALLCGELAVLLVATVWWLQLDGPQSSGSRYGMIAMLGVAMGAQSGAISALGVGVSTTYITGTWTSVSMGLAHRLSAGRRSESDQKKPGSAAVGRAVLVVYIAAATAAGYLFLRAGAAALWLPVAALGASCVAALLMTACRPAPSPGMALRRGDSDGGS